MWNWETDRDSIIATFLIDAQIDLTNEMIGQELFLIILHELAVKEGSIFALKISARSYNGYFAKNNNEWSRKEHQRWMNLKSKFAINNKPKTLKEIANDMLKFNEKRGDS